MFSFRIFPKIFLSKIKNNFFFFFLLSLIIVFFAQPDLSMCATLWGSVCGFSFFWWANSLLKEKKKRFLSAFIWFFIVSFSHLNWFTADRYVGAYIFVFLAILLITLGLFFATLSLFIPVPQKLTLSRALSLASVWTLFEWGRLFILSGFSWNPLGILMTSNVYSMQMASLFGILGLTFWVLFTNLIFYKFFKNRGKNMIFLLIFLIAFPFGFGITSVVYHDKKIKNSPTLSTLLLQTALYPEEKMSYPGYEKQMIPLYEQWERIFYEIKKHNKKTLDLIVLPEGAVPYGTFLPIYKKEEAQFFIKHNFSQVACQRKEDYVGNAFFAENLAKICQSDFVVGLEDGDHRYSPEVYNAAFLFHTNTNQIERYEKRILVPMGEYIPFAFCKKFLSRYGITDSFTPGKEAKVFMGKKIPLGFSICYEETYGHLMRQNRQKGAELLVNLTNDVWYPHSRLPIVHFQHGRLRAIEGGLPLVRSCNTGVTCALDSLGRLIDSLPYEKKGFNCSPSSLYVSVPLYCYKTLYTYLGDMTIISFSLISLLTHLIHQTVQWKRQRMARYKKRS